MSLSLLALAVVQAGEPAPPPLRMPPPIVRIPAPPAPPPPVGAQTPAQARANLASYLSSDDYPADAMFNGEEGTTTFRLQIGGNGRVIQCTVLESSGAPSLDEATCRIMRSRARFRPALDSTGTPTEDSISARIAWRLGDEPERDPATGEPLPPAPGDVVQRARPEIPLNDYVRSVDLPPAIAPGVARLELTVSPAGRISGCAPSTGREPLPIDVLACRLLGERARFTPARTYAGSAVEDRYRTQVDFSTVPPLRED